MTRSIQRLAVLSLISLVAVLAVGVTSASAHGGRGGPGGTNVSSLVTEAAKQLTVARADLKAAIVQSAEDRIDQAVEDEDIDSDQGDELKADVEDNLTVAYRISQTRTVASNLKITTAQLNTGFRAARKALATKQIDTKLANGDITADEAATLKANLDKAKLPGYKSGGVADLAAVVGYDGPGGGHCGGGPSSSGSDSGSSDTTSSDSTSTTSTSNSTAFRARHR